MPCTLQALKEHAIRTMVIEPGYVATDMVLAGGGGALIAERMIQPADVAEAALLPARLSPAAVPC